MTNTTCTEDRIQHALERCLHGLSRTDGLSPNWSAGLCLNYWSLEELVNRDPDNFIILAEKVLERTKAAQENCEYDLLAPLALMFYFAVLRTPCITVDCNLLQNAFKTFHVFLTWPSPYCDIYQEILSFISEEQKAPGISYQRLVRAEQGLLSNSSQSSTVTVLLVNPAELPKEFMVVAERLSSAEQSVPQMYISLIQHVYQACLGPACDIAKLGDSLKCKTLEELQAIYSELTETLESAAGDPNDRGSQRDWLKAKLLDIGQHAAFLGGSTETNSSAKLKTIPLPVPKCHMYTWDQDNFDVLHNILQNEEELKPILMSLGDDVNEEEEEEEEEDEEEDDDGTVEEEEIDDASQRNSVFSNLCKRYVYWNMPNDKSEDPTISSDSVSFVSSLSSCVDSGYMEDSDESSQESPDKAETRDERPNHRFKQKIRQFFKTKTLHSKYKLKADVTSCSPHSILSPFPSMQQMLPLRRAGSLCTPQVRRVPARSKRSQSLPQHALGSQFFEVLQNHNMSLKKRPFLSCDEDLKVSTLRVVVFGSDRISGKLARAYSNLRMKESNYPFLTRFFKLQLYYIPVKRNQTSPSAPLACPESPLKSSGYPEVSEEEESTIDISHYISMLDPWYKRNIQGLMGLPTSAICQHTSKAENNQEVPQMPILTDMLLYYCRFATRSLLLQLYQAEITFDGGRKQTEVFIQSLELGHSAALRAIRASGPGCKRFGIDGDREAIPFTLQIVYSKSTVSGRSRWNNGEKVCTSVSLRKACKTYEELDNKMECLNLNIREVIKRQNSKTKKSFNQISISQIKVDKAQIIAQNGGTFPLCLDQDERKILQRVIKCEVSPCYKPESRDCRRMKRPHWTLESPNQFCSLLCLPIATFSGALL